MRRFLLLTVLSSVAFAPAPLPRRAGLSDSQQMVALRFELGMQGISIVRVERNDESGRWLVKLRWTPRDKKKHRFYYLEGTYTRIQAKDSSGAVRAAVADMLDNERTRQPR